MTDYTECILVGMSGTGKSSVGRAVADRLGWELIDTDQEIERREGRDIPAIFASCGEAYFRAVEREVLLGALRRRNVVIATGGGAVLPGELWTPDLLDASHTLTIALDVPPEISLDRLQKQAEREGAAFERPLLAGNDPLQRLTVMKRDRHRAYDRARLTLDVSRMSITQVADQIASLLPPHRDPEPAVRLHASTPSDIYIGARMLAHLPALVARHWPRARTLWLAIDENVDRAHGERLRTLLAPLGARVETARVPSGETSKSVAGVAALWDWMLDCGVERGDVLLACGGGVTGDLAGFAAASVLRGINLVQIPTTLLSMVDSSVGGKTGINHRAGKNLIGAFYQPPLVVIDPDLLASLPARELTSGWAEVLKHAVIQPATPGGEARDLLATMEHSREHLLALDQPAASWLIRRNIALKAAVVQADERESGLRQILNFGHTLGHAIEAAGYSYLHGEAIAVGMCAAIRISRDLGLVEDAAVDRLETLIAAYGLPTRARVDPGLLPELMASDKKRSAGMQRWILAKRNEGVVIEQGVPAEVVRDAIEAVIAAPTQAVGGLTT